MRAYPGIELRLAISNTEQVARMVLQGSADLGFVEGEVDESLSDRQTDRRRLP